MVLPFWNAIENHCTMVYVQQKCWAVILIIVSAASSNNNACDVMRPICNLIPLSAIFKYRQREVHLYEQQRKYIWIRLKRFEKSQCMYELVNFCCYFLSSPQRSHRKTYQYFPYIGFHIPLKDMLHLFWYNPTVEKCNFFWVKLNCLLNLITFFFSPLYWNIVDWA